MELMFVSPLNSYSETLIPKVMVLGDEAFRRWSGIGEVMRAGPLWWNSCPYRKSGHETALSPLPREDTVRRWRSMNRKKAPSRNPVCTRNQNTQMQCGSAARERYLQILQKHRGADQMGNLSEDVTFGLTRQNATRHGPGPKVRKESNHINLKEHKLQMYLWWCEILKDPDFCSD